MEIEKGRALHWFIQRITGLVLGFGVIFHFLMFHYFGYKIGLTYLEARERLISPGWITFYSVLLGMAIFHGDQKSLLNSYYIYWDSFCLLLADLY
jgi:succinate dehydrogenase hydrophobic anchor subunit